MRYEQENKTLKGVFIIQVRYTFILLTLLPLVLLAYYCFYDLDIQRSIYITKAFLFLFVLATAICTLWGLKSWGQESVELSEKSVLIFAGTNVEKIALNDIEECVIYNIFGNKNFALKHSGKVSGFLINGLKGDIVADFLKHDVSCKVRQSGILETFKFIYSSSQQ